MCQFSQCFILYISIHADTQSTSEALNTTDTETPSVAGNPEGKSAPGAHPKSNTDYFNQIDPSKCFTLGALVPEVYCPYERQMCPYTERLTR